MARLIKTAAEYAYMLECTDCGAITEFVETDFCASVQNGPSSMYNPLPKYMRNTFEMACGECGCLHYVKMKKIPTKILERIV